MKTALLLITIWICNAIAVVFPLVHQIVHFVDQYMPLLQAASLTIAIYASYVTIKRNKK